jgi:hypothetical protein
VLDHTRDGRYMAFAGTLGGDNLLVTNARVSAGERGHIAMMDRYSMSLKCEIFLNESVRAVQ